MTVTRRHPGHIIADVSRKTQRTVRRSGGNTNTYDSRYRAFTSLSWLLKMPSTPNRRPQPVDCRRLKNSDEAFRSESALTMNMTMGKDGDHRPRFLHPYPNSLLSDTTKRKKYNMRIQVIMATCPRSGSLWPHPEVILESSPQALGRYLETLIPRSLNIDDRPA